MYVCFSSLPRFHFLGQEMHTIAQVLGIEKGRGIRSASDRELAKRGRKMKRDQGKFDYPAEYRRNSLESSSKTVA